MANEILFLLELEKPWDFPTHIPCDIIGVAEPGKA
jgi:hypothetical protein